MVTKRKTVKKKTHHSPLLNLLSPIDENIKQIKILKNMELPENRWGGGKWDHLIVQLEKGDCVDLEPKPAMAFANRARNLGYVIVSRKMNDSIHRVWFEGMDPNFDSKKNDTK